MGDMQRLTFGFLLCMAVSLASSARADTKLDAAGLSAHMTAIAHLLEDRIGGPLPVLTDADYLQLAAGQDVISQQAMDDTNMLGATVFRVCDVEAWRIWLAICDRDHHEEFMPHIREGVCLADFGHSRLVYQYLALPAIKDRHWVIRTRTNGPLWNRSGHTIWESSWELEPGAEELISGYLEQGAIEKVTAGQAADAVVTPRNDGCWLLVDLPAAQTFVAYQDLSDIGGNVPAWLVNELGPSGLAKLVQKVEARASQIEQFFDEERLPPAAPDGSRVEQLE